jgi:hypothetical protein
MNPRGAARAPVGNLTSLLVECVPVVKEVACLVLGSSDGIALATFRTVPGYPSVLPGLDASEPTDCKDIRKTSYLLMLFNGAYRCLLCLMVLITVFCLIKNFCFLV